MLGSDSSLSNASISPYVLSLTLRVSLINRQAHASHLPQQMIFVALHIYTMNSTAPDQIKLVRLDA